MLIWYGVDFGETMMNPYTLHQSRLIRRIFTELGRSHEAEPRVERWRKLRDGVGSSTDSAELRVRFLKQYERDRIYKEVLDDEPDAIRLFEEGEASGFSPAKGLREALQVVKRRGATSAVVSETSQPAAALAISRFLGVHSLGDLVEELITPAGRFTTAGVLVGWEFIGKTKKDGTLFDQLGSYLALRGIELSRAAMVGDDPLLDVARAKSRGFVTVQYRGIVDRGESEADYVIDDWAKLPQ